MEYEYARIDLSKTNYKVLPENQFKILRQWNYDELMQVFSKYCAYKKFRSVLPLWYEDFASENTKVFGYYQNNKLIAWSLMLEYPYAKCVTVDRLHGIIKIPCPRLGIKMESECILQRQGIQLYLHGADEYKNNLMALK